VRFDRRKFAWAAIGANPFEAILPPTSDGADRLATTVLVRDFGAKGNAESDDTISFQNALDAAEMLGKCEVYSPPGRYLFAGPLNVPGRVTLRGSYTHVPSHPGICNPEAVKPGEDGTTFLVIGGKEDADGTPFLTLKSNSAICGFVIYYPEQVINAEPYPYPWAIRMLGVNPAVQNVELLNPYQAGRQDGRVRSGGIYGLHFR